MIHTAKLYLEFENKSIYDIEKNNNENINLISQKLTDNYEGLVITFTKRYNKWFMFITIDFIKLLSKSAIGENDYKDAECRLNKFLKIFGANVNDLILIRIDYRLDTKITNKRNREVLFYIYRKAIEKYGFKKKYDQYESTIYFNSKSIQVVCYDKEKERNSKSKDIKAYEEDILRLEVRLQNRHLNYIKKQYKIEKKLERYFKEDFYKKYIKENSEHFLYRGNYYKIYIAEKIINDSKLKESEKMFLREFLIDVSKNHIDWAMKKYSKYRFNKAVNLLNDLNINPILIPKNLKCEAIISNPFNIK